MEKNLAARCTSAQVKTWSAEYLEDAKATTESQLRANYGKWFLINDWKTLGVARAGYCLGYHAILAALRDHTFGEVIHMNRASANALVEKTLKEFAGN